MKIISVVGNRPQYIKSALVNSELRKHCKLIVVNTGQHYDYEMADIFFEELGLPEPEYDLQVGSGSHAEQTANIMLRLETTLEVEKPDKVIVYGDTNSTLAGALTAVKMGIPVAHIEAGPRQDDLSIPEEVNRVIVDHISQYLFAPTHFCAVNLLTENICGDRVFEVGDVMLDNFQYFNNKIGPQTGGRDLIVVTIHRPINTDNPFRLKQILSALCHIEGKVVFPMHPRTRKAVEAICTEKFPFESWGPVGYLEMLKLLAHAKLVITDSGGLQKEAFFAGVPCITLDINSPWEETVDAGCNEVVRPERLLAATKIPPVADGPYDCRAFGDGQAHKQIVEILLRKG